MIESNKIIKSKADIKRALKIVLVLKYVYNF